MHIYHAFVVWGFCNHHLEEPTSCALMIFSILTSYVACIGWVYYLDNYGYYSDSMQRLSLREFCETEDLSKINGVYKYLRVDLYHGLSAGALSGFTLYTFFAPEVDMHLKCVSGVAFFSSTCLINPMFSRRDRIFIQECLQSIAWVIYTRKLFPDVSLSPVSFRLVNMAVVSTTFLYQVRDAIGRDENINVRQHRVTRANVLRHQYRSIRRQMSANQGQNVSSDTLARAYAARGRPRARTMR